jgi:hypothetical protein
MNKKVSKVLTSVFVIQTTEESLRNETVFIP